MSRTNWARLLRYLAVPFVLAAVWHLFHPHGWPAWVCTDCLLVNSVLLVASLWLKPPGSAQ